MLIKTNARLRICSSFSTFRELEAEHIFIGDLISFTKKFLRDSFMIVVWLRLCLCSCSFLRKLYDSSEECPRSYDKLHFNPRYLNFISALANCTSLFDAKDSFLWKQ